MAVYGINQKGRNEKMKKRLLCLLPALVLAPCLRPSGVMAADMAMQASAGAEEAVPGGDAGSRKENIAPWGRDDRNLPLKMFFERMILCMA